MGDAASNTDLSQRRADKVREFLLSCGFDGAMLEAHGKGRREPTPGEKPLPEEGDRRAELKIISHPIVAKP